MSRFSLALKAIRELGPIKMGLFAAYQLGLRTGFIYQATQDERRWTQVEAKALIFSPILEFPDRDEVKAVLGPQGEEQLLRQADEIVAGRVRLFGGQPVPLRLDVNPPLEHWTAYELGKAELVRARAGAIADVKFIWEPARFGWVYTLGRAYFLNADEHYAAAFWSHAEAFWDANPPYLGPHWVSAQEVALRLMALAFGAQIFGDSEHTTSERATRLAKSIAVHAGRIPPTLIYARSQNNNHLLSEAAGLYTAGMVLPRHPMAKRWRQLGWHWFNAGLVSQIAPDGAYMQHSANYQRLMLQAALWMDSLIRPVTQEGERLLWPQLSRERLAAGTRWLLALADPQTGLVPNLGPNDGAYILPLTVSPFNDYRPVLQATGEAFLNKKPFPPGQWDEMGLWLGHRVNSEKGKRNNESSAISDPLSLVSSPHVLHSPDGNSWAYLRAAHFTDRPGHADQLHLDLWWRGLNIAQDAGTYLYNASLPWDNALATALAHNTVTVDGRDQMTRAGRFLYLDWAQASVVKGGKDGNGVGLVAQHDGYRSLGLTHRRSVSVGADGDWTVQDSLLPGPNNQSERNSRYLACLHWLMPDWSYQFEILDLGIKITLNSPNGLIGLMASLEQGSLASSPGFQLARAGELLEGSGDVSPTWGWSSPTYGEKTPALALRLFVEGSLPLGFISRWSLPKE